MNTILIKLLTEVAVLVLFIVTFVLIVIGYQGIYATEPVLEILTLIMCLIGVFVISRSITFTYCRLIK